MGFRWSGVQIPPARPTRPSLERTGFRGLRHHSWHEPDWKVVLKRREIAPVGRVGSASHSKLPKSDTSKATVTTMRSRGSFIGGVASATRMHAKARLRGRHQGPQLLHDP